MTEKELVRRVKDEEILLSPNIPEDRKETVRKLIGLRETPGINNLMLGVDSYGGIHARVNVDEDLFEGLNSFQEYLEKHGFGLPTRREGGISSIGPGYMYLKDNVSAEFMHFD